MFGTTSPRLLPLLPEGENARTRRLHHVGIRTEDLIKSWISRGLNPHGLLSEDTNIDTSINQACV